MLSAGHRHACFIRTNGTAAAHGLNLAGQCNIPVLPLGRRYEQVSCGGQHTLLLRDDGTVAACGDDSAYQILRLSEGEAYSQVSAGQKFSLLLTRNGIVHASGENESGQCDIPPLEAGVLYTADEAGNCHS